MIKVSWNQISSVPGGPAWYRFSASCYQSVKVSSVFAPDPFQYNNIMFFLSDRSVKASVPWYSNWKETLMELNTSTFYSGIFFVVGASLPNCPLFLFHVPHPPFLTISYNRLALFLAQMCVPPFFSLQMKNCWWWLFNFSFSHISIPVNLNRLVFPQNQQMQHGGGK